MTGLRLSPTAETSALRALCIQLASIFTDIDYRRAACGTLRFSASTSFTACSETPSCNSASVVFPSRPPTFSRFTEPTYYAASVMLILALAARMIRGILETASLIALLRALNDVLVVAIESLTIL